MFDALAKEGLKWNAETKQIKKLKWRAEKGDVYWTLNNWGIGISTEVGSYQDDLSFNNGFYFKTQQQAEEAFKKVKELLLSL